MPRQGIHAPLPRQLGGVLRGAAHHPQMANAVRPQGLPRQAPHLARSHDEYPELPQIPRHFRQESHRFAAHAGRPAADAGFRAGPAAGTDGRAEGLLQQRTDAAHPGRGLMGLADLSQDLGLAEHHGIEARGNQAEVAQDVEPGPQIEMRPQRLRIQTARVGQQLQHAAGHFAQAVVGIIRRGIQFSAIAGGEQDQLGEPGLLRHGAGRRALEQHPLLTGGQRKALAKGERRGSMVEAYKGKRHDRVVSCEYAMNVGCTWRANHPARCGGEPRRDADAGTCTSDNARRS